MGSRIIIALVVFSSMLVAGMAWGSSVDRVWSFIDLPSVFIVVGVISSGAIWSFPISILKQSFADAMSDEELQSDRADQGHQVFLRLSQIAVASGLLGTLIGLVKMLSNMADPTTIGPAMAVALLTLFYGVIVGEFVFKSMANSFLMRAKDITMSSNRGHTTVYFAIVALFVILTTFFVMLLAFADFPV